MSTGPSNRFASARNAEELVGQIVGAASTCWRFDAEQARAIVRDGVARLGELADARAELHRVVSQVEVRR